MKTHTPGPWKINVSHNGETTGIISANEGLTHVCDTFDAAFHNAIARGQAVPASDFLLQAQANARLIAAAPDLLESLRKCVELVNKAFEYEGDVFRRGHNDAVDAVLHAEEIIKNLSK